MNQTQLHYHWCEPRVARRFRMALSLHSHTMHSLESLEFVPRIARTIPVVREIVLVQERRCQLRHGRLPDYANAYWTPPLPEREAVQLEQRQIEDRLALKAIVSLTDHDSIEASSHLHLFEEFAGAPVSVEWTVPYGPSFLHLGVHNLPRERAREWMGRLAAYTAAPGASDLRDLLAALSEQREILVVLNHPFWDELGLGAVGHQQLIREFLDRFGPWLHALELNGMRPWPENQAVMALARSSGHQVISGGDRHGSEPNAVLNLANAGDFAEFIDEVRRDRISDVLLLSQYREPYRLRYAEALWDVMREYPEQAGRVRWTDRFFYRSVSGGHAPLSAVWGGDGPGIIGTFMSVVRFLFSPHVRPTLRLAMRTRSEVLP